MAYYGTITERTRRQVIGYADRVKFHDARRAFQNGEAILISERGDRETIPVTPMTVVHTRDSADWDELVSSVRMWSNRYPNQRYYIVNYEV